MEDQEYDQEAEDLKYRNRFHDIRPIFEEHAPNLIEEELHRMIHFYLAAFDAGIGEVWIVDQEKKRLSEIRGHVRALKSALSDLHPLIFDEIDLNLTLPTEVLGRRKDRKNCAETVFDAAPSTAEANAVQSVLRHLVKYEENLQLAIKYTEKELPVGIPIQIRNKDAWSIVQAAAEACRAHHPKKKFVPTTINGSGPFRRLLIALFDFHDCHGNVDGYFNQWVAKIDGKMESFDLLSIY